MNALRFELSEANAFVDAFHRHHKPVTGHRFSFGAFTRERGIVGVAICGRPNAKAIDQKHVLEVLRCCTLPVSPTAGYRNACSYLYGKAARVAAELGFRAVITYTLAEGETGASLRAMGWWPEVLAERDTVWHPKQPTPRGQGLGQKVRWLWLTGCGQ